MRTRTRPPARRSDPTIRTPANATETIPSPRAGGCRVIFLDLGGTLIERVPFNIDPSRVVLKRGVSGLQALRDAGFRFAIVANEPGVALGRFPESSLLGVHERVSRLLRDHGIVLDDLRYCPHHPHGVANGYGRSCSCRKPEPGLIHSVARRLGCDLERSWMVGDSLDDVEAGHRAGCRSVLVDDGAEIFTDWVPASKRKPDVVAADLQEAARLILAMESRHAIAMSRMSLR